MNKQQPTIIIGGGWSGLAAAVKLSQHGHAVHLIDSAKQLGGRARSVHWLDTEIDNGQHLMIGAYDHMLAMMELLDIDAAAVFNRLPMDIEIRDTQYKPLCLSAKHGWLPWPLSLARNIIKSAGIMGLYHIAKLQNSINTTLSNKDITVSNWLLQTNQPVRLIKQLWEPLCLATLNTPIIEASAHLLAIVLRDSLGKGKSAADLLIPIKPLGELFPIPASNYIEKMGGKVSLQTRAKEIMINNGQVSSLRLQDGSVLPAKKLIIACSPSHSIDLLDKHITLSRPIDYPICTVYLQYSAKTRLAKPMLGLSGTMSQWAFDRSEQTPGLMAVVISGPGKHSSLSNEELIQQVQDELRQFCPELRSEVTQQFVVREKRATFASTVDIEQHRPQSETAISGLWLAGDYISNGYPATLEGAIRNGENCAQLILNQVSA